MAANRFVRGSGGRFAGSVGAGKEAVPTTSTVPGAMAAVLTPTERDAIETVYAGFQDAQRAAGMTRLPGGPAAHLEPRIQWFDTPHGRDGELLARPLAGGNPEEFFTSLTPSDHLAVVEWQAGIAGDLVDEGAGQVGVNVPNSVVTDPESRTEFLKIAAAAKRPVCFEFTEQSPLADPTVMNAVLDRLRSFGHTTALDDYGDGYHDDPEILETYRFDKIKIARPHVMAAFESGNPVAVLGPVLRGAQARGQRVVVEGVDDPAMLATLRDAGFTTFQSYLHHRPEPVVAAAPARV